MLRWMGAAGRGYFDCVLLEKSVPITEASQRKGGEEKIRVRHSRALKLGSDE
jgi:hypothetical protein